MASSVVATYLRSRDITTKKAMTPKNVLEKQPYSLILMFVAYKPLDLKSLFFPSVKTIV